ncbi:MAG: CoA transferase, partial [Dehalococcoidia bacterium]
MRADQPPTSPLFLYLNVNKHGVVLDPMQSDDRTALGRLIEQSDVFVTDLQPAEAVALDLTPEALLARAPQLVAVSVTPFGLTGPRADAPSCELVDWAASGYAHLTPAGGKREGGRPLKPAGAQGGFMAGASTAAAVMAALHRRESSGRGQAIDVSIQETLICANDSTFARSMTHGDNIPTRLVESSFEFLPCKDGYVSLLFVREDQWERMVAMMGNPEWATTGLFASWADRRANWDAVAAMLSEYFIHYTREELYRTAQAHRIPLAPVTSAADVLNAPQLNARRYFVDLPLPNGGTVKAPGAPYRLARTPWSLRADLTRFAALTAPPS